MAKILRDSREKRCILAHWYREISGHSSEDNEAGGAPTSVSSHDLDQEAEFRT